MLWKMISPSELTFPKNGVYQKVVKILKYIHIISLQLFGKSFEFIPK